MSDELVALRGQALQELQVWTTAVLKQCSCLNEALAKYFALDDEFDLGLYVQVSADARLFVFSVHQALLAARLIKDAAPIELRDQIATAASGPAEHCPDVRLLRNVIAHHDEYLQGTGALQKGYTPRIAYTVSESFIGIAYAEGVPELSISIDIVAKAVLTMFETIQSVLVKRRPGPIYMVSTQHQSAQSDAPV
jgi:hypothetical protein